MYFELSYCIELKDEYCPEEKKDSILIRVTMFNNQIRALELYNELKHPVSGVWVSM